MPLISLLLCSFFLAFSMLPKLLKWSWPGWTRGWWCPECLTKWVGRWHLCASRDTFPKFTCLSLSIQAIVTCYFSCGAKREKFWAPSRGQPKRTQKVWEGHLSLYLGVDMGSNCETCEPARQQLAKHGKIDLHPLNKHILCGKCAKRGEKT